MEKRMTQEHRETPIDEPSQATVEDFEPQVTQAQAPAGEPDDTLEETTAPADDQTPDEDQPAGAEAVEEPFEEDSWSEDASGPEEELDGIVESDEDTEDSAEPEDAEDETVEADAVEEGEVAEEQPPTVESVVEAILFATDEPLTDGRLSTIVETTAKQVRDCIQSLNEKYERNHSAFRIEQIAGGYQMLTLSTYNSWLRKMLRARSDSKLSPAAMETLAIIAYKQPVIRVDIEAIRGVAVGEVIRSLMYKGLVKIVGRAEILGRPMLYGTTKKFLEVFGLNTLKDLPKVEELKKPD
jgi:segregation and condensation protein B